MVRFLKLSKFAPFIEKCIPLNVSYVFPLCYHPITLFSEHGYIDQNTTVYKIIFTTFFTCYYFIETHISLFCNTNLQYLSSPVCSYFCGRLKLLDLRDVININIRVVLTPCCGSHCCGNLTSNSLHHCTPVTGLYIKQQTTTLQTRKNNESDRKTQTVADNGRQSGSRVFGD